LSQHGITVGGGLADLIDHVTPMLMTGENFDLNSQEPDRHFC
jgi:hypothetical protein